MLRADGLAIARTAIHAPDAAPAIIDALLEGGDGARAHRAKVEKKPFEHRLYPASRRARPAIASSRARSKTASRIWSAVRGSTGPATAANSRRRPIDPLVTKEARQPRRADALLVQQRDRTPPSPASGNRGAPARCRAGADGRCAAPGPRSFPSTARSSRRCGPPPNSTVNMSTGKPIARERDARVEVDVRDRASSRRSTRPGARCARAPWRPSSSGSPRLSSSSST